ncbi:MAG: hypothetical protein O7D94_01975, partial [Planctomycetota bacterium]|nr:hypothetical protein [Planctomycetota bacterium]
MKVQGRLRIPSLFCFGMTILTTGSVSRADVGPPVEIKMPVDTPQAVAGQVYAGVFRVQVFKGGAVTDFEIAGEGWTVLTMGTPKGPAFVQAGVIEIPFRAIPANPDEPIVLTLRYNGRRVRQAYEIGPAYFDRAGKPYHSARVQDFDIGGPGADAVEVDDFDSEEDGESDSSGPPSPRGGTIQVEGRIVYSRPGRDLSFPADGDFDDPEDIPPVIVGADNIDVRIWDSDPVGHDEMWSGFTDENGYFVTPMLSTDVDGDGSGPDLVLYYETETDVVDVTDNSIGEFTYTFESDEETDFTGNFYDFGTHAPTDTSLHPALHIFNGIVRTHRFIEEKPGYITPSVQVEWPDGTTGAYYSPCLNEIHISTDRQWRNDTHSHEYGHRFMRWLYGANLPEPEYCIDPSCDPDNANEDCGHCTWCQETDHDAWGEGWSSWLADVVTRDYPNRYTHDVNGPPFVPLYTRSAEFPGVCADNPDVYEDSIDTEGFISALLRDIDDAGQDDHDDNPAVGFGSYDGIFDLLCLGPNEIFYVTDIYQPVTIIDFINGFLAEYPQHTDLLWPTAMNVGGAQYVSMFPADTEPPGLVPSCDSSTHPIGTGGPMPCMRFEWSPARDDVKGANIYSYIVTTDPAGQDPGNDANAVSGTSDCRLTGVAFAGTTPGLLYYFSIKAKDNAGNWGLTETFGPFEITDCNGSGLLDLCDIDCHHTGDPDFCNISTSDCIGSGCGASNDCNVNFVPDECDITSGFSEDCNFDGIPDDCQNMARWVGGSGLWQSGANWDSGASPALGELVCIDVPGDVTVTYEAGETNITELSCHENLVIQGGPPFISFSIAQPSFVVGNLTFGDINAVLTVDSVMDVGGLFTWPGQNSGISTLTGAGVTTLNGGLQISSGVVALNGHELILANSSTALVEGRIDFGSSATLRVEPGSTYHHQGSTGVFFGSFGDVFDNDGTFIKSVDTGTRLINIFTDNSSLIHVQDGVLILGRGSSSTGDFLADPGSAFEFRGGGHEFLVGSSIVAENVFFESGISGVNNVRGTYNVSTSTTQNGEPLTFTNEANIINYGSSFFIPKGTVNFDTPIGGTISFDAFSLGDTMAGTANFNTGDPVVVNTLVIGPGTFNGPSDLTVNGLLTWKPSGHFDGSATLDATGGMIVEAGGGARSITDRVFNNAGVATFLGGIGCQGSAAFNNLGGA